MRTILNMSKAGMTLQLLIDKAKTDDLGLDFDSRAYLVDKLEAAYYDIQSDIMDAVTLSIGSNEE